MLKKLLSLSAVFVLVFTLLSGCTSPLPDNAIPPTQPPTAAPTAPPIQSPTQPPTEAPTQAPTEAPTEPPLKLTLKASRITLVNKSETYTLYDGEVPLENVSWYSDNESIALFSQGTVVAISPGTTTVYARFQDQEASCIVSCDVPETGYAGRASSDLMHAPRMGVPVVDTEDTSFFDDAAFIGDSVSYVLQQYHLKNGVFGSATFLTRSSLGLQNSLDGRMTIFYQGQNLSPEEALRQSGAKKVFIMLDFNDISLFGIDGTIQRWEQFTDRILELCPDMEIYIQSCTPIHDDGAYPGYDNELFDAYNQALEEFCREKGFHFVNIAPYFKDFYNGMASRYSSDQFVHMNYQGTAVWEKVLKAYAAEQKKGETK